MANRLAQETSPYLLQHANNPVDWYPWSAESLERAAREDKPILLSIGYAACHWCHVMEHESFEDEATARLMNERFVNIKVDREERPDLDAIYMTAVQSMTGHGGWPMTMFLTPEAVPFYAGTYFPGEDRPGMPSFRRILVSVSDAYSSRRDDVERTASRLRDMYDRASHSANAGGTLSPRTLELGYRGIAQRYDVRHGGFEGAPKFPQAMALDFLLRYWRRTGESYALEMVLSSFRKMARGGIYDQVGSGFHRYSVDAVWLVPHFEKMLYDNALLARLGVHLYQATGDAEVKRVAHETIDWVAREMSSPDGGFYSSLDADSEGEEGKFYVWRETELDELLGDDSTVVKSYYGATAGGNFEGHNILFVLADPSAIARRAGVGEDEIIRTVARARATLYAARSKRVPPGLDDKVIASWNGLMLRAIAEAARVFGSAEYHALAVRSAEFLWSALVSEDAGVRRVFRVHSRGVAKIPGFLDDYAALALAFIAVYQLTLNREWLDRARSLGESVNELFWDDGTKQFFDTASDAERLITRPREITDNAVPSGNSLAAELMLLLAEYFGEGVFRARADAVTASVAETVARHPTAFGHLLGVIDMAVNGCLEIALVGDPSSEAFRAFATAIARAYLPGLVLAGGAPDSAAVQQIPLLEGRGLVDGKVAAYVCRNYSCDRPMTDPAALASALGV